MKTYINTSSQSDSNIYYTGDDKTSPPERFQPVARTFYHVKEVKTKDESDYHVRADGRNRYFKFSSAAGKKAWKNDAGVGKTVDITAANCADCLLAEKSERLIQIDSNGEPVKKKPAVPTP